MSDQRLSRWMGFLGLAILVLLGVGIGALGGNQPNENASGASVVNYFNTHQAREWASVYVVGLGLALMVLYASHLRGVLRGHGSQTALSNAAFAGGILFVAGGVAIGSSIVVLTLAAHNHQIAIAKTFNFYMQNGELGFLFGAAVFALASGLAILTGSSLPKWLGWLAIVVGIACIAGPISFIGFIALGVWLPIAGFVVASRARCTPPAKGPEPSGVVETTP
jgi:hypothetical protein